jgi:hypothetical protein
MTLCLAALPAGVGAESAFVAGIRDLPLMDGLARVNDAGVQFDKPAGRIVEAFAEGRVPAPRVRRFYRRTLPQLGWERVDRDTYAREGEVLELDYFAGDGPLTVRYTLRPE